MGVMRTTARCAAGAAAIAFSLFGAPAADAQTHAEVAETMTDRVSVCVASLTTKGVLDDGDDEMANVAFLYSGFLSVLVRAGARPEASYRDWAEAASAEELERVHANCARMLSATPEFALPDVPGYPVNLIARAKACARTLSIFETLLEADEDTAQAEAVAALIPRVQVVIGRLNALVVARSFVAPLTEEETAFDPLEFIIAKNGGRRIEQSDAENCFLAGGAAVVLVDGDPRS